MYVSRSTTCAVGYADPHLTGKHVYNGGDICGILNTKYHRTKFKHGPKVAACKSHPTFNKLPCECFPGPDLGAFKSASLQNGTSGVPKQQESARDDSESHYDPDDALETDGTSDIASMKPRHARKTAVDRDESDDEGGKDEYMLDSEEEESDNENERMGEAEDQSNAGDGSRHDEEVQSMAGDEEAEEEGEDPSLNYLVPMICVLCLEKKKGVEWDIALAKYTGESEEEHLERVGKVVGFEWTGERDDQYHQAIHDICETRGDETTADTNTRCGILRLTLRDMARLSAENGVC